jgi:hypothetical protein
MAESAIGVAVLCGMELVPILVATALFFWGRAIARKHGTGAWRWLPWLPVVAFVLQHAFLVITIVFLVDAFGDVGSVVPPSRATVLARGISEAMNAGAFALAAAIFLYVASAVAIAIGAARAPRIQGRPRR